MSFLEELCIASENKHENLSQKIWSCMKARLLTIATEKSEWVCHVKFKNISHLIIAELERIIESENIYFAYWYQDENSAKEREKEIGMISWDIGTFLSTDPFNAKGTLLVVTLDESNKVSSKILSTTEFSKVLISNTENEDFERKLWELMKPYLIKISKDRHANGCHILFENISMTYIKTLKEIVNNENIAFDYREEGTGGLLRRQIVWKIRGFWLGDNRYYRNISDKMLKIKQDESGEISIHIEEIKKEELETLKHYNTYIS